MINNLLPLEIVDEFRICVEHFTDNQTAIRQLEQAQGRIQTILKMKPESVEKMLAFWPIPVFTEVGIVPLCQWRQSCWD